MLHHHYRGTTVTAVPNPAITAVSIITNNTVIHKPMQLSSLQSVTKLSTNHAQHTVIAFNQSISQ